MQPPAESVQDSGQCINAPCEDAPPHIAALPPSQDPEPTLPSATVSTADIILSVPAMVLSTSPDLPQTDRSGALALGDSGAEGGASQGMATSAPGLTETPMAAVKLESVLDPTELSTVSAERWRSRGEKGGGGGGQGFPSGPLPPKQSQSWEISRPNEPSTLCGIFIVQFYVKNSCK